MRKMHIFRFICVCAKTHPGICIPLIHSIMSNNFVIGQQRTWSDCTSVQSDLGLCYLHMPKDMFSHGRARTGVLPTWYWPTPTCLGSILTNSARGSNNRLPMDTVMKPENEINKWNTPREMEREKKNGTDEKKAPTPEIASRTCKARIFTYKHV